MFGRSKKKMTKKINITTNLTPNLIMHIFSCLEIEGSFYDSQYGMKHRYTLENGEYDKWDELSKKCGILGLNSELFSILFQIPSYIPTENIDMVLDSFDCISEAISEQSIQVLLDSYPGVFDELPIYVPISVLDTRLQRLSEHEPIIQDLIRNFQQVLENVWNRFYQDYWENTALPKIEQRCEELSVIIQPINIITAWKKKLSIDYPYSEFCAVLVEPTTTLATDLLVEKVVFPLKQKDLDFYRTIVHEVGRSFLLTTNLLENDHLKVIAQSNIEKVSTLVDAACATLKKQLDKRLNLWRDEPDPYEISLRTEMETFSKIWNSMEEKDIFKAIARTYDKLSPVV